MSTQTLMLFGVLAAGLLLVAYLIGVVVHSQEGKYKKRINKSVTSRKEGARDIEGDIASITGQSGTTQTDSLFKILRINPKTLQAKLKQADLKMKPAEYLILVLLLIIGTLVVLRFSAGLPWALAGAAGLLAGLFFPKFYVEKRIENRTGTFNRLFPDALDLMVRGLRTGLPVSECIKSISKDSPHPVNEEFSRIRDDVKLGVPLGEAVQKTAERLHTQEFNFFSIALTIQSETGGNLAENLENLSDVLRKRQQIYRLIKAKSAESVWTGRILSALPFVVIAALYFMSPGYLVPLYKNPMGQLIAGGCFLWLLFGLYIMRRMVRFDF